MISKTFFDSNILLYSGDTKNPKKQIAARAAIKLAIQEKNGVISTQVIQEFCAVEVKTFQRDHFIIKQAVKDWGHYFEVVIVRPAVIEDAIEIGIVYQLSFWDSLIVAAALAARCGILMTEDLNHGQTIQGLTILNPFKD